MTSTPPRAAVAPLRSSAHQPLGIGSASLATLTVVLWGGTAVSNQFAQDVLPPMFLGGARFALAAVFMFGWCLVDRSGVLLKRGQWAVTWLLSLLLFLQIATFNIGTAHSSSSHASILVNSYIFWVAGYELFIGRTLQLRWWQVAGLLLAAAGCSCLLLTRVDGAVSSARDQPTLYGDAMLALSGLVLGIKVVATKRSVQSVKPGPLILWHDILGAGAFFLVSAGIGERSTGPMTSASWAALLFSGLIVSGFCFGANARLLRRHGASQISVFSFATPIFGVAAGVLLRGDHLSAWLIASGLLVAAGIFFVNLPPADR